MKRLLAAFALTAAVAHAAPEDEAYFRQFLYSVENTSEDPDYPSYQYRFLMSDFEFKYEVEPGVFVRPSVDLFLHDDHTYVGTFSEFYEDAQGNSIPGRFLHCTKLRGEWNVPQTELMLPDFLSGARTLYERRNAIEATFLADRLPTLAGRKVVLDLGYSNQSEAEALNFCWD